MTGLRSGFERPEGVKAAVPPEQISSA